MDPPPWETQSLCYRPVFYDDIGDSAGTGAPLAETLHAQHCGDAGVSMGHCDAENNPGESIGLHAAGDGQAVYAWGYNSLYDAAALTTTCEAKRAGTQRICICADSAVDDNGAAVASSGERDF